jgi:hypothetical protein
MIVCRKELVRGGFGGGFPGMEEAREKLLLAGLKFLSDSVSTLSIFLIICRLF